MTKFAILVTQSPEAELIAQNQDKSTTQPDSAKRQERAHRILDAAADLILRWGYNKTTIDDIAKQAGVGKGTIYLHWTTREDLFLALIARERLQWSHDFLQRIAGDPEGWSLRNMLRHSALGLVQRPLLKAIILGDLTVLGKLAHSEPSVAVQAERLAGFQTYLEFLRAHDLVRSDLSIPEQIYMISAIFMGFFLITPLVPDAIKPSDETMAAMMAETVHRALESGRTVSADELQGISEAFREYVKHDLAVAEARFQQEIGT
jgi:AcrR family transcriptional regulator